MEDFAEVLEGTDALKYYTEERHHLVSSAVNSVANSADYSSISVENIQLMAAMAGDDPLLRITVKHEE